MPAKAARTSQAAPRKNASAAPSHSSLDMRADERREFENRKMQRIHGCDEHYMKCVRLCSTTKTAAAPDNMVFKRKREL